MSNNPFMDWKPAPGGPEAPIGDTLVVHWKIDAAYASGSSTKKFEGTVINKDQSWLHLRDRMGVNLHIPKSFVVESHNVTVKINPFMSL